MGKIILAVAILAAVDAATTIAGIEAGIFYEANPLMGAALDVGVGYFLFLKAALTLLWVVVMHRAARRIKARWLTGVNTGIAGGYGLVVVRSLVVLA